MSRKAPFEITPDLSVEYILRQWPETIPVFLKYRLSCVGCDLSEFEKLSDTARVYHVSIEHFLEDLHTAISQDK